MKSVIVMCLLGFLFGAPILKNNQSSKQKKENVDELTAVEYLEIQAKQELKELREKSPNVITGATEQGFYTETLLAIAAGEVIAQEDLKIFLERLIGNIVKAQLKAIKDKFPGLDTKLEKLRKKGLDLETHFEEMNKEILTRFGVENYVKKILAGEYADFEEVQSLKSKKELKLIFIEIAKGVDVKYINEVFNQGFVSGYKIVRQVIGPMFYYRLRLDNGIAETRNGSEGPNGTSIMHGSFTIPLDNGEVATFNWVADENGYRVESPYLPTPPPAPPHVAELLRIAEEQRAAGISFDG